MDSKVLVDICTRAGITGKGSALASLTEEELAKLNAFMAKSGKAAAAPGGKGAAGSPAPSPTFRREDYIAPAGFAPGKVPVLPPTKPEKPAPLKKKPPEEQPASPAEAAPPAPPPPVAAPFAPVESPISEAPVASAAPTAPVAPAAPPAPVAPVVTGPVPMTRAPLSSRPPLLRTPSSRSAEKDKERDKDRERTGPGIMLAPMPAAHKPPSKAKRSEPAPQKPDIKLPKDAIRASKAGGKPLSEHIRKHEEKRAAAEKEKEKKPGARKGPQVEAAGAEAAAAPAPTRERPRRGVRAPAEAEEGAPTVGGREQRQLKRKKAAARRRVSTDEEETTATPGTPRRRVHIKRTGTNTAAPRKGKVSLELPCTVRTFSEAIGVPARDVLAKLMGLGTIANINAELSSEMAQLLAMELGVEVDFQRAVDLEEKLLAALEQQDDAESLQPRPPIVTFLGHVDHGKTSLLDRIIGIDVVSSEKGGITQHIRAYRVEKDGRAVAFVDTPGHEAFTEMRARGANVTDIAVLVVAADDGVMPQTEEAISHARAAGVPIVVALNKIDLPGLNIDRVMQQLATNELLPSQWGGEIEVVQTSAVTGRGMDDLLETLLTVAELHEYRANPDRPARGTCLEAQLHEGRGVVAKLLVQNGTLRVGDVVVCGPAYGRVKAMYDTLNTRKRYDEAGPSMPVDVTGLHVTPGAGDRFYVLDDISAARQLAESRAAQSRRRELTGGQPHVTLETLYQRLGEQSEVQTLHIILRADVRGSIEAIRKELTKLEHPEVQIKILQATVGGITEADVHLADASDAVIIGFNVVPDEGARALADRLGVQIRRYDIIYQVTDELKAALQGMLKPEQHEKDLGRALVQRAFHISRIGVIAGCRVLAGTIQRDARTRVIRESRIIGDYAIDSLKREKDDAREVREGMECGIKLAGFNDVKEGDVLEAYKIEQVARTL